MSNNNKKIMKELVKKNISVKLDIRTGQGFKDDPKRFLFSLSRYKFVSKIFEDFKDVLEIGAGYGFKSFITNKAYK